MDGPTPSGQEQRIRPFQEEDLLSPLDGALLNRPRFSHLLVRFVAADMAESPYPVDPVEVRQDVRSLEDLLDLGDEPPQLCGKRRVPIGDL
jgi:hypothetical protein